MVNPVLEKVTYGLYAVCVLDGTRPTGCIINTLSQVTAENPLVSISISKNNYTTGFLKPGKKFGISILSEKTAPKAISALGFFSGRDRDKMDGLRYEIADGVVYLKEACCGHLVLEVISVVDAETHQVILSRVLEEIPDTDETPMTYDFYHKVIKGKAPKNAPTYRKEDPEQAEGTQTSAQKAGGVKYACTICGYVYNGELDNEPESYRCPICGVDKTYFKRMA